MTENERELNEMLDEYEKGIDLEEDRTRGRFGHLPDKSLNTTLARKYSLHGHDPSECAICGKRLAQGVGRKELYTCSMPCERFLLREFGIYRLVEPRIGTFRVPIK